MAFINYFTNNYCKGCELRFLKSDGIYCPKCGSQARTAPRHASKNKKKYRENNMSI